MADSILPRRLCVLACFLGANIKDRHAGYHNSCRTLALRAGRLKELINRGGEKIAPREIDELLLRHPAVAEVVAFGVPHKTWGEEVAAAVVLREPQDEAAILKFWRERLADFKCPKKLYIVDALPRAASGK